LEGLAREREQFGIYYWKRLSRGRTSVQAKVSKGKKRGERSKELQQVDLLQGKGEKAGREPGHFTEPFLKTEASKSILNKRLNARAHSGLKKEREEAVHRFKRSGLKRNPVTREGGVNKTPHFPIRCG